MYKKCNYMTLMIVCTFYNNSDMKPAQKRLVKDLQKISGEEDSGINASPDEDNLFKWTAFIEGPERTVWEGGLFQLTLEFS